MADKISIIGIIVALEHRGFRAAAFFEIGGDDRKIASVPGIHKIVDEFSLLVLCGNGRGEYVFDRPPGGLATTMVDRQRR